MHWKTRYFRSGLNPSHIWRIRVWQKVALGRITGLNVLALIRGEATLLAPPADKTIQPGDNLLVEGIADPTRLSALGPQVMPNQPCPHCDR